MNINNLKIYKKENGNTISNYKKLCEVLDLVPCSGNQKIKQMEEIQAYVNLTPLKGKNGFKIGRINSVPKPILKANYPTAQVLDTLVLNLCAISQDSIDWNIELSTPSLLRGLGFFNHNFTIANYNRNEFSNYVQVTKLLIDDLFNRFRTNNIDMLERGLKRLKRKGYIRYDTNLRIYFIDGTSSVATPSQKQIIVNAELEAMKELGFTDKYQLSQNELWKEFYIIVHNILKKEGISTYFEIYQIVASTDYAKLITTEKELLSSKGLLNSFIIENARNSAIEQQRKAIERNKNVMGKPKRKLDIELLSSDYIKNIDKILDLCINISNTEDITGDIEGIKTQKILENQQN